MSTELAVQPSASQQLATQIGMNREAMLETFKAQCFRNASAVSDAQLAAFVSIACEMKVNPLLPGMLYAYPTSGGGIVPIMGPDGVYKKLTEHPEVDSWETVVYPEDITVPPTHAVTKIWRKGRERPLAFTALLSEWKISANPNWNTRPRHMLGLRSLKQCARQVIHGIPGDEDDRHIMGEINVTPAAEPQVETVTRKDPPPRKAKGAGAVVEAIVTTAAPEKKAEQPVAEVQATPVAEKKPEAAPATPTPAPAAEPAAIPHVATGRAFLQDKEEVVVECMIEEVSTLICMVTEADGQKVAKPSVQAKVKGGFMGLVHHFGGATAKDDKLTPLPEWKPGAPIKLWLLGKLLKSGKVLATVQSIAGATTASQSLDVE